MDPTTELVVQIPLGIYSNASVDDAGRLHSRLVNSGLIPEQWTVELRQSTNGHEHRISLNMSRLLTCSLSSAPRLQVEVTINSNCTWMLHIEACAVDVRHIPLLSDVPARLDSAQQVGILLSTLDASEVCTGNPEPKFV